MMKQFISKQIVGGFTLAMLIIFSLTNLKTVNAESITNNGKDFKKAWELSLTVNGGAGVLRYGYNTLFINEDYAHAYHSTKPHYSYVRNAKGIFAGPNKKKKKWSKIEITHKGNKITYANVY